MYCTHCGHENPAGANYCGNCGRPLTTQDDPNQTLSTTGILSSGLEGEVEDKGEDADEGLGTLDLEPGSALLVAVRGPNQGARFLLDRDMTTVGRHPESDIFLDDITVSRRHAEFRRDAQGFWVHDVGSLNGTYVNGERAEERQLKTGDEVQVGKFKLVAYVADAS
jgi:pSer/pThr/pTyr-binding forkhead associated (FHA) protein